MIKSNENATAIIANAINDKKGKFLFFSGSNSSKAINQQLVTALAKTMHGETISLIDLKNYPMPLYSDAEEANGIPEAANNLLKLIEAHDSLVIAVPEHNHSMPAFFKNTIDWMSRARSDYRIFIGKEVILVSTSPGSGGNDAIFNTRIVLESLGATVIGGVVLNYFDQHVVSVNEQIQITNINFLSAFNNLLHQPYKKAS